MNIQTYFWDLIREYMSAFDDLNIYAKSIEKYAIELDSTLYSAIEEGKKQEEEELKKQSDGKPDSYIR
jgi:hypothetical protein